MKRCPFCGAKNKDQFDFCVRCSASLEEEVSEASSSILSSVVPVIFLILLAIAFWATWRYLNPSADESPSTRPTTQNPTPRREPNVAPSRPFDVERAQSMARAGMIAFHEGQYERAIMLFREFVGEAPDNPFGHMYLGLSLFQTGENEEAIQAMEAAFDLAPDNPGFGHYLVGMLIQKGDIPGAEDVVRRYLSLQPDDEKARVELIRLMRRRGELEDAIAEGQKLIAQDPENINAVLELGTCLKDSGQITEAKALFLQAVDLDPNSATAQHALGVTHSLSGDYEQALAPLEVAVALDPENGLYHLSLAQAYENLDYIQDSFEEYEAFLKFAPDDPRAQQVHESLERARAALKERQAAEKDQEKKKRQGV